VMWTSVRGSTATVTPTAATTATTTIPAAINQLRERITSLQGVGYGGDTGETHTDPPDHVTGMPS
jgi:hypothetical protein